MSLKDAVLEVADKMEAHAKEDNGGSGGPLILYALALRMAVKAADVGLCSEVQRQFMRAKEDMSQHEHLLEEDRTNPVMLENRITVHGKVFEVGVDGKIHLLKGDDVRLY